ncbi:hypothetical protein Leryth_009845 [Lithospermum erythrorhizon]|uniref:Uncharacterized protein n=1 Tax=Lithospermum erythrorhizon TaxID=34254 RepID=A0AAV3R4A4_LITER|nr:hypothetical protein Leryth_009845 [Lithospermum erythrorhizon]
MGGGGILRSVHRGVRTGGGAIQESLSANNNIKNTKHCTESNSNTTILTLSSSNTTNNKSSPLWEYVYGIGDKRGGNFNACFDECVFGTVPSVAEVHHAVSALQKVAINSNEEEESVCGLNDLDWIEPPSGNLCNSKALRRGGFGRVGGALDLLQTDPSVQKMVISISSDEAVWKAVLNNEAVREFRDSMSEDADKTLHESPDDGSNDSNAAKDIARWIRNQIQAKVNQLVEKIMMVFHEVFESSEKINEGESNPFEGKLRTSFFLSLVVMLLVAVTRAHDA